jgi:glycosyltransferase involved in cell wall biosynthesis
MKIAITHPTTFSRVRRGTERVAEETAKFMAKRGHAVTFIACKPGKAEKLRDEGVLFDYHRRWWHPALAQAGLLEHHSFLASTFFRLLRERFDVVHSFSFTDGFAAILARKITGVPNILTVNAIPPKISYYRSLTTGGAIFKRAVQQSTEVTVPSHYVNLYAQQRWGRTCVEFPAPVDMDRFPLSSQRDLARPIMLCTAALDDPRKGGPVIMRAFNRVKETRPELIFQVASDIDETKRRELMEVVSPKWREDVYFLGNGKPEDLPARYGGAAVTVLASLWEAFGMVSIESMATGTPVAGTRDGALPEIINDEAGSLFDPGPVENAGPSNDQGLAESILKCLELSRRPETANRCRSRARLFSWQECGSRMESLYERVIAQSKR